MTITEIMESDKSASEKLVALTEIITTARKAYGNTEVTIEVPTVTSTDGIMSMKYLNVEDKLAIASSALHTCIASAISSTDCAEGSVFDKELERELARNAVLVNLTASTDSKYL